MKKIILLFASVIFCIHLFAQSAMGEWNLHLAYSATNLIAVSPTRVYARSGDAMFSVQKDSKLVEYYSKIDLLTGTAIAHIGFDNTTNTLVVVYKNGLIDLIKDDQTNSIIDLYNKQLNVQSKAPNDIAFKDGRAYMAMQFGIVVLNISKQEIADTYYIGANGSNVNLLSVCLSNDTIAAISATDLYTAPLNSPNLLDFSNWTITPVGEIGTLKQIVYFNNRLVASTSQGLYIRNGNTWEPISGYADLTINRIRVYNNLLVSANDGLHVIDSELKSTHIPVLAPIYDAYQEGTLFWVATGGQGIGHINGENNAYATFIPDGPAVNIPYRMTFYDDALYVVPGGRWAEQYRRPGYVMIYSDYCWKNIYTGNITSVTNKPATDFMNVAVMPSNNKKFFVTSYGTGLYEFEGSSFVEHYDVDNSIIGAAAPNDPYNYTRTDGAVFDKDDNLFFVVAGNVDYSVITRTASGEWIGQNLYSNGLRIMFETPGEIVIDRRNPNYKWIPYTRVQPGLILWDNNGTVRDPSDDVVTFHRSFTDQNSNVLTPDAIYCMAQDRNGVIWLGTDLGPIIIPASTNFKTSNACRRILLNRDDGTGLADYLLDGVRINCIAVDGGNRKWVGTATSGVYLLSEDGTETIEHFTTTTSPLISDEILSLAIDSKTGIVYIGTGGGLMSYQSDAAEPRDGFNDVYAYPNPVRENHDGKITIAGLMENSTVKIVDSAGRLVYETTSQGSLAVWDGNNARGERVSSGVYIVLANSEDGSKHSTTKILIMNR